MSASTTRRQANEKAAKKIRLGWRKVKGVWPMKDPKFIAWLHRLDCVACFFGRNLHRFDGDTLECLRIYIVIVRANLAVGLIIDTRVEAAHVGDRGNGQTCSDREACPLCKVHHDRGSKIGHHVLGKTFWTTYGIPKAELIEALNALYDELVAQAVQ